MKRSTIATSSSERVRRFLLFWAASLGFAGVAAAAESPAPENLRNDLESCYRKTDGASQLACYNALSARLFPGRVADPEDEPRPICMDQPGSCAGVLHGMLKADPAGRWPASGAIDRVERRIIDEHLEPSYVTFGSGLRLGGDQTRRKMLYEGQIAKNIQLFDDEGRNRIPFWVDLPIRIGLRQLTADSYPVATPSFNPGLRVFWAPRRIEDRYRQGNLHYYSLGVHHHSNGQDGPSALDDGAANTRNGSFSTNYIELAAHLAGRLGPFQWGRIALRHHFHGTWEPFQDNQYERQALTVQVRTPEGFGSRLQLRFAATYGMGYRYVVKNDVDATRNEEAGVRDRLHATVELLGRPSWGIIRGPWKDVALFVRYDIGHDYYNINFQNRMNRLQFGVITTNF